MPPNSVEAILKPIASRTLISVSAESVLKNTIFRKRTISSLNSSSYFSSARKSVRERKKRALAAGLDPMRMLPRTGLRAADTLVPNPKATTTADAVAYRAYGLGPKLWPLDRFIDAVDDRPQTRLRS